MLMCSPDNAFSVIALTLLVVNAVLLISYKSNCDYLQDEFKKLEAGKKKKGETYNAKELREEIPPQHWYAWVFGICICLDIWILGAIATHWWAGKFFIHVMSEDNNKALFGDSFGAVNALISAFAFAGMIVAFILQRYELRLQRKELEAQRNEFEKQNETLRLQRFENTFFSMMSLQQQIVDDLSSKKMDKMVVFEDDPQLNGRLMKEVPVEYSFKGRNLFLFAFSQVVHEVEDKANPRRMNKYYGIGGVMEQLGMSHYDDFYTSTYFDHYFRHFYRILKFVEQNSDWLTFDEQYKYTSMLRGTLSRYELVWLFYNGLSANGNKKLKPLMEDYSMLKNLRADLLVLSKENRNRIGKVRLSDVDLKNNGFSGTDYEFYLTEGKGDESKYCLSAFYSKDELENGKRALDDWGDFSNKYGL